MASNFPEVGGLLVELVDLSWFSNPTSSLWVLLPSISGGACGSVDLSYLKSDRLPVGPPTVKQWGSSG
jgi:hypothetical protein